MNFTAASLALTITKLALSLFKYAERQSIKKDLRNEYAIKRLESAIRVKERRDILTDNYSGLTDDQLLNDTTDKYRRD